MMRFRKWTFFNTCLMQAVALFLIFGTPEASAAEAASRVRDASPSVDQLRAAFPGQSLREVSPEEFRRIVMMNPGSGRLLTGPALAAALAATGPAYDRDTAHMPQALREHILRDSIARASRPQNIRDSLAGAARKDSLAKAAGAAKARDSAGVRRAADSSGGSRPQPDGSLSAPGNPHDTSRASTPRNPQDTLSSAADQGRDIEADETRVADERSESYIGRFILDLGNGHWGGGSGDKWAVVIYVVVGAVVAGAFLVYGAQSLYDVIVNKDDNPVFKEIGLRYSYSGQTMSSGRGSALYRDANLIGLRFAIGLDKPGMGLGLTAEGGYIDLSLHGIEDPSKTFDFRGGYFVAGPMVRFGDNRPMSFSLEFLNGTSNQAAIGWISKARMAVETRVGGNTLLGAHVGAVFYDLHFFDGLALRSGDFNRDLSLVIGLDAGYAF